MSSKCSLSNNWKRVHAHNIELSKEKAIQRECQYDKNPNICGCCGVSLPYNKRRNKFCSSACSATLNNTGNKRFGFASSPLKKHTPTQLCVQCGNEVKRNASKYCSQKCMGDHIKQKNLSEWLSVGIYERRELYELGRRYYLELHNHKCDECGWNKINPTTGKSPLNIEHIDGDCTNNVQENIKVLCPSCHSLTPTYGSLNKGKSKRVKRYKAKPE